MEEKSYLIKLFWMIIASFTLCYAFISYIDPHQNFGLNKYNKCFMPTGRMDKANYLENNKNKFQFFIIGSSGAAYYDPLAIEKFTGQKTYIFNIASPQFEEYIAIANQISQTQNAKTIFLHLDFHLFNKTRKLKRRIFLSPLGKYILPYMDPKASKPNGFKLFEKSYLSLSSLRDAIKVLKRCGFENNPENETGNKQVHFNSFGLEVKKINIASNHYTVKNANFSENKNIQRQTEKSARVPFRKEYFKHGYYDDFLFDEAYIEKWLGFLKQIVDDNHINLIIGLAPINKEHLEKFNSFEDLKINLVRAKRTLINVFGTFYDFHNCSTQAFQGPEFWEDSTHPTPKLMSIMTKIFLNLSIDNNIPALFGKKVTRDNVAEHFKETNDSCN